MVESILRRQILAFFWWWWWGGGGRDGISKETEFLISLAPFWHWWSPKGEMFVSITVSFLVSFWKEGLVEQVCHVWVLSSYLFLRSILEKERGTEFRKQPSFCTSCRANRHKLKWHLMLFATVSFTARPIFRQIQKTNATMQLGWIILPTSQLNFVTQFYR